MMTIKTRRDRPVTTPPVRPKIFHITHVDNLRSIVAAGEFLSDVSMIARGGPQAGIGMSSIKRDGSRSP